MISNNELRKTEQYKSAIDNGSSDKEALRIVGKLLVSPEKTAICKQEEYPKQKTVKYTYAQALKAGMYDADK